MAYEIKVQYSGGDDKIPTATVIIRELGVVDSDTIKEAATSGNGPVNAICEAVQRALGIRMELEDFSVLPIGSGSDAVGKVVVRIKHKDKDYEGSAEHTDTIIASARAIADAVNQALAFDAVITAHTV